MVRWKDIYPNEQTSSLEYKVEDMRLPANNIHIPAKSISARFRSCRGPQCRITG